MTDQPSDGVAASIDATYAIRQPAEHCGNILRGIIDDDHWTECVLRPGHHGSHANETGTRWIETTPAGQSALDRILADADHHDRCANLSKTDEGAISHSSIAAGLRIAAEHVRHGHDTELEASQRRAIRIQTLLDDTRDRARKSFAVSRESERQLQQQIDAQAKEIDRLRDAHRHEEELSADLRNRLKATSDACSDATTLLYRIGELHTTELSNEFGATECRTCRDPWPCDTANILAALEPTKETRSPC